MKSLKRYWLLSTCLLLAGCLDFGDDIELSGAEFDATKLAEVSTLTGINFPAGSRGVEYFYQGSGIDDALAAKIEIPESKLEEFKTNPVFQSESDSLLGLRAGSGKPWWRIEALSDRIDRQQELPMGRYLAISLGKEGDHFYVYLSWITT